MANETESHHGGILYVVATPIGNLGDIGARTLRVLGEADLVACEDTRRSATLLSAHHIRKPLISYFEHNEERRIPELVGRLRKGEKIALITDAGTPGISDPGFRLVRAAHQAGVRVVAIPGPSALVAALSIAGLPTDRFAFEGFLPPRTTARRKALEALVREPRTLVFFEAARRLAQTLAAMAETLGGGREAAVVREMTKTFEETARGTLADLARRYSAAETHGEVTVVVAGAGLSAGDRRTAGSDELSVEMLCEAGLSLKQASTVIARLRGGSRREVYQKTIRDRARKE